MKEERTYTYLIWQYKDYEPIGVLIDEFAETQIGLGLLDMVGLAEWFRRGSNDTNCPNCGAYMKGWVKNE